MSSETSFLPYTLLMLLLYVKLFLFLGIFYIHPFPFSCDGELNIFYLPLKLFIKIIDLGLVSERADIYESLF